MEAMIERLAEILPKDTMVSINIEQDSAWVEFTDYRDLNFCFEIDSGSLKEQMKEMVERVENIKFGECTE